MYSSLTNEYIALNMAKARQIELEADARPERVVLVGAEREREGFINRWLRETRKGR